MTSRLGQYFADYEGYHRTRGNKICHYAGIPLIMVSFLGLLSGIAIGGIAVSPFFRLDGGTALVLLAGVRYLFLDWRIGIPFLFVSAGAYFLGRVFSANVCWVLFILGWIFQGIGHAVYEKKSPAFFKNFEHLLIGPLWIFARLIGYRSDS